MSHPCNGVTPEIIRDVMPPYHLSAALRETTFAALPQPPQDASTPSRHSRITRRIKEIVASKPTDARQDRLNEQRPDVAVSRRRPRSTFLRINPLNPEPATAPGPNAVFEFPRIDPINREPDAKPGPDAASASRRLNSLHREPAADPDANAVFDIPRIDPMNPDTTAPPGAKPHSTFFRIDPVNPEPGACPGAEPATRPQPPRLPPIKAQALRITTLANTWQSVLPPVLAQQVRPPDRRPAGSCRRRAPRRQALRQPPTASPTQTSPNDRHAT
jgi:hypothetical protein